MASKAEGRSWGEKEMVFLGLSDIHGHDVGPRPPSATSNLYFADLRVWRTNPGSVFDYDPAEDNIQSRSLHLITGKSASL